ncbi:MAG: hypothetical protein K6A45_01335 [Lachnospiraceae bacterium]|jgi:hypothetical protein|nr:hypothetical protein [Lachnospiraceae bacterium]
MGGYIRKTHDVWELVTNYGYGEEVECSYDSKKEAKADYAVYRKEKRSGFLPSLLSVSLRKRRVPNV